MHYVSLLDAGIHAAAKQFTRFYSSKAINYSANGSVFDGAKAVREDYHLLKGSFAKLIREFRTIIFVSDDAKGTHTMHAEAVTVCHPGHGTSIVAVPTSRVYTLAMAEMGGSEDGLQIWGIRSFLNLVPLEKARSMQG